MSNSNTTFALSALAVALMSIYVPAASADDPDTDTLKKPTSEVSVGIGVLSGDDRRQLGIVGGLRDTGGYLLLDADINIRDESTGTWKRLAVSNMGMSSREIRAEFEQQGNQGVGVEYRQSNREVPYLINTGVTGIGTAIQTVPTRCTAPNTPAGCYAVDSGQNYQLGTERTKIGLDFFKYFTPKLKFKVVASSEDKDGDRHARVGGQPEFAAQPIDWNVKKLDANLDYIDEKFQASGGYSGSWFSNSNDLLTVSRGGTPFYISQPQDSQAHQVFLNGGYSFTPTTRSTFKLSYTHATQDEHIPTADVSGLAWAGDSSFPAAPSHLDGEVNTTLLEVGLTSRPTTSLSLLANLRYHDVDDRTPAHLVINTISSGDRTLVHSTPLSYETLTGKLEASYRLPESFILIGGVDYSKQDRTVPFGSDYVGGANTATVGDAEPDGADDERYVPWRAELKELTYRAQLRRSMSENVNGALAFLHSKRDGAAYDHAHHSMGHINPINISDRDRNKWRVTLDWSPVERLGLQFNYEDAKDDYGPSNEYGLNEGKARLFSIDADYAINQLWRLSAWYSHDVAEANQFNGRWDRTTENHEIDRRATLKDSGDSVGLGFRGQAGAKVKIGGDLQWTRTKSHFDENVTVIAEGGDPDIGYPSGVSPLTDIRSTVTRISLFAEYALEKNDSVRFDAVHERWNSNDWSWNFSDGSAFVFNDGTKVIAYPKQNSTFFGVRYKRNF